MKNQKIKHLSFALGLIVLPGVSLASGFALIEQNASGLGNAYAGQAASAQDASTVFFNPAGLSLLPNTQLVLVGNLIQPSSKFSGTFSAPVGGGQGGDAGSLAFVPNFYFAYPLTSSVNIGVGINSPFGLKTEYDSSWVGRFQAIKSDLKTINLNPSIAWKIDDQFSLGVGLSVQRVEATLTNAISPLAPGSMMTVKGDDYGYGFNLGLLWQANENTRAGIAYRSKIDYTLSGTLAANAVLPSSDIKADITMPDSASLSVFHKLSPSVDLLADVTWTGWSSFDRLAIVYTSLPVPLPATQENWKDSWRYSLGANYHMNDQVTLRGGLAFDQTPVPDAIHRTARIPDEDRIWLALGGQYRMDKRNALDFGYAHLFVKGADINNTTSAGTLTGSHDNHVDILSAQYTHTF
jgi:long-chain fatty acid transport protein